MRIASLTILAAMATAGCGGETALIAPPTGGEYALVRVDGQPLPAAIPGASGVDLRVGAGRLTLADGQRFTLELQDEYKTTSYGGYGYGTVAYCSGQYDPAGTFVAFHLAGPSDCGADFRGFGGAGSELLRVDYHGASLEFRRASSR
jgi:hypothetical protein